MTILHTENQPEIQLNQSDKADKSYPMKKTRSSLVVRDGRKRTALIHGISPQERFRLDTATHFLEQQYGRKNVYVCIEFHHLDEAIGRDGIRKFKSDFVQLQRRAGFPVWYVEVLEAKGGVHSNLIGPLPVTYAKRLQDYSYGPQITVTGVSDMSGLRNYLLKESTPQAVYGTGVRREKGSHPLGDGGGDRVRLSKELRAELSARGLLNDAFRRTYASRGLKKHLRPTQITEIDAPVVPEVVTTTAPPPMSSLVLVTRASGGGTPPPAQTSWRPGVAVAPPVDLKIVSRPDEPARADWLSAPVASWADSQLTISPMIGDDIYEIDLSE